MKLMRLKRTTEYVFCILLAAILLLSLCSCGNKKIISASQTIDGIPASGSRKIVVFGDSIAAGYGLSSQDQNYVNIFAKNIGASLKNDAVSGYESADMLALLGTYSAQNDIINANIVVISIGGNDLLHKKETIVSTLKETLHGGKFFTDDINAIYTNYEANLTSCISIIKEKNPNAKIIIQTLYNPAEKQGYKVSVINVGKLANRYIDKLNESILTVCANKTNVYVFDVSTEMNKDAANFYNLQTNFDIHPTVQGHQTLAKIYTDDFNALTQ